MIVKLAQHKIVLAATPLSMFLSINNGNNFHNLPATAATMAKTINEVSCFANADKGRGIKLHLKSLREI